MSDAVKMRETFRSVLRVSRMIEAVAAAFREQEKARRASGEPITKDEIEEVHCVQRTLAGAASENRYKVIDITVRDNGLAHQTIIDLCRQQWVTEVPLANLVNTHMMRTMYLTLGPQLFRATADSPDNDNEYLLFILDSVDKETTLDVE